MYPKWFVAGIGAIFSFVFSLIDARGAESWQFSTWKGSYLLKQGIYRGGGNFVNLQTDCLVNADPGSSFEKLSFAADERSVFRVSQSVFQLGGYMCGPDATFDATGCGFEGWTFGSNNLPTGQKPPSHWRFQNCVFLRLDTKNPIDPQIISIQARQCTFHRISFPDVNYHDLLAEAQSEQFQFVDCRFVDCIVPESLLAATVRCVFENSPTNRTDKPLPVVARADGRNTLNVTAFTPAKDPSVSSKSFKNGPLDVTFGVSSNSKAGSNVSYKINGEHLELPSIHPMTVMSGIGAIRDGAIPGATPVRFAPVTPSHDPFQSMYPSPAFGQSAPQEKIQGDPAGWKYRRWTNHVLVPPGSYHGSATEIESDPNIAVLFRAGAFLENASFSVNTNGYWRLEKAILKGVKLTAKKPFTMRAKETVFDQCNVACPDGLIFAENCVFHQTPIGLERSFYLKACTIVDCQIPPDAAVTFINCRFLNCAISERVMAAQGCVFDDCTFVPSQGPEEGGAFAEPAAKTHKEIKLSDRTVSIGHGTVPKSIQGRFYRYFFQSVAGVKSGSNLQATVTDGKLRVAGFASNASSLAIGELESPNPPVTQPGAQTLEGSVALAQTAAQMILRVHQAGESASVAIVPEMLDRELFDLQQLLPQSHHDASQWITDLIEYGVELQKQSFKPQPAGVTQKKMPEFAVALNPAGRVKTAWEMMVQVVKSQRGHN